MTTDPHLPDILVTAASGVGAVRNGLSDKAHEASYRPGGGSKWSGPSAATFTSLSTQLSRDIGACAGLAADLEGALRRAAKSASQRLYWEAQERERLRREALAKRNQGKP